MLYLLKEIIRFNLEIWRFGSLEMAGSEPSVDQEQVYRLTSFPNLQIFKFSNRNPCLARLLMIEKEIGKEAVKEMLPMQPGEVFETYADTTALSNDTGYKPSTPLNEGVQKFLAWYLDYYI